MVTIPQQEQVEVFANTGNSVTIKQFDVLTGEHALVVVQPQNVPALVKALRQAAKDAVLK